MVGAWFVTDGVTVTLEAYDALNNLLDSTTVSSGFYNIEYAELRASGIKYVIFHDAGDYWGLDDLTYVPETAPWLQVHPEAKFYPYFFQSQQLLIVLLKLDVVFSLHS